jgi:hypothetical protein
MKYEDETPGRSRTVLTFHTGLLPLDCRASRANGPYDCTEAHSAHCVRNIVEEYLGEGIILERYFGFIILASTSLWAEPSIFANRIGGC